MGYYEDWLDLKEQLIEKHRRRAKEAEARVKELETDLKLNASMLAKQCDLAREAEASLTRLLEAVEKLKPLAIRTHYYCEDCWFTCPKHPEGCCNEAVGPDCNCGADEHNREVEAFYQVAEEIKKGGKDEI